MFDTTKTESQQTAALLNVHKFELHSASVTFGFGLQQSRNLTAFVTASVNSNVSSITKILRMSQLLFEFMYFLCTAVHALHLFTFTTFIFCSVNNTAIATATIQQQQKQ